MRSVIVPTLLIERLGDKGATALSEMLEDNNRACADYVLERTAERFERRLVEETSKLRVDMAQMRSDLHGEILASRFELIKWNFVFWIGQVVALSGIISLLLRSSR